MLRLKLAIFVASLFYCAANAQDLREPQFNYDDVERFGEAIERIEAGVEPEEAFEWYLDSAGAGLYGWSQRYNLSASRFARAYEQYPDYLKYLGGLRSTLEGYEDEITEDLVNLRDMIADVLDHSTLSILPTYYFISPMGGGGSAEPIANMIAIDYYGRNADAPLHEFTEGFFPSGRQLLQSLDSMAFVASHEMVHWYQTLFQGEITYLKIYLEEGQDTLLARAVREGGADFIARLASDAYTLDQLEYGDAREEELWRAFRAHIFELSDDNRGWFSGRNPQFPDAPWQIGYYVGMRMSEAYYQEAEDKNAALRTILTASTVEEYTEIMEAYDRKWE